MSSGAGTSPEAQHGPWRGRGTANFVSAAQLPRAQASVGVCPSQYSPPSGLALGPYKTALGDSWPGIQEALGWARLPGSGTECQERLPSSAPRPPPPSSRGRGRGCTGPHDFRHNTKCSRRGKEAADAEPSTITTKSSGDADRQRALKRRKRAWEGHPRGRG